MVKTIEYLKCIKMKSNLVVTVSQVTAIRSVKQEVILQLKSMVCNGKSDPMQLVTCEKPIFLLIVMPGYHKFS